jgi:hypothetical protein
MSNSDSFFDDDSLEMDSFPGQPSEELLRESDESFEQVSGVEDSIDAADTPDAVLDDSIESDEESSLPVEAAAVAAVDAATDEETQQKSKGRFNIDWAEVTIFDAILFASLLFICLATLLLFFELRNFGNFPFGGFPWRTDGF